ncbi:MAG: hypothetical protein IPM97_06260 [Bdellovibrionaceae bacterium]|nr:hypothetical protein [Pseudobdellovibrionaceae bacterium]
MKFANVITLALFILFAAPNAKATPVVGDKAVFSATLSLGKRAIMDGTATFVVVGRQPETGNWVVDSITNLSGKIEQKQNLVQEKDLLTEAAIDDILSNCAAKGGVSEVVTVPAGTFQACAVPKSNETVTGTVWVAKVPFGYVKGVGKRNDGISINGVLENYSAGAR